MSEGCEVREEEREGERRERSEGLEKRWRKGVSVKKEECERCEDGSEGFEKREERRRRGERRGRSEGMREEAEARRKRQGEGKECMM